jgi:subtilisin family serine protease
MQLRYARNRRFLILMFLLALAILAANISKFASANAQERRPAASGEGDSATPDAPDEQEEVNRLARLQQKIDGLRSKVEERGSIRVIIGLRGDFKAEAGVGMTEAAVRMQRRDKIERAQNSLLNKLFVRDPQTIKRFRTIPYLAVELDATGLEQLKASGEIESIAEDKADAPSLEQSTTMIGAPQAWNLGFTGQGQTVAILDTGVDNDHSFLSSKIVSEACFSTTSAASGSLSICPGGAASSLAFGSADNPGSSLSGFDHGTHVAGIAAGRNATLSGVARDANIIAIKVFSRFNDQADCGSSPAPCLLSFRSDQIEGLERVMDLSDNFNIAAVNLSLGGGNFTSTCDSENQAYTDIVNELRASRIATVIASGNGGNKNGTAFPACISTAISVGSVGDGSNGATQDVVVSSSQSASFLKLLAPGRWINSSVPGNAFANKSGTSMAAPHVAGAFAALKEKSPNASVTDLLMILQTTGVAVTDQANNITKRRINLGSAINGLCTPNSYNIAPTSINMNFQGGPRTIQVFAPTGSCLWQARSTVSWITVLTPAPDSGNGLVNIQIQPHFGFGTRTGRVTIAGRNVTVTQSSIFF